jgi:uncharacterized repeat protein (TIGR01451 family)
MSRVRLLHVSSLLFVVVLVLAAGLPAAGASTPTAPATAPVRQATPGSFLTGPNLGDPLEIALTYLGQAGVSLGLAEADLADLVVTDRYTSRHNGVTHLYLRQTYAGIQVYNATVNANIAADGSVISLNQALIPSLGKAVNTTTPKLSAADAVHAAAASLGLALSEPLELLETQGGADQAVLLSDGGISLEQIPAKLVYQPMADGSVRLAWNVSIYQLDALHWWDMRIDALDGQVLDQSDLVIHDDFGAPEGSRYGLRQPYSTRDAWTFLAQPEVGGGQYNVYATPVESPSHGGRSIVSDPANVLASPYGWHDINGASGAEYTTTQGNNAHAYTDTDNNNSPDSGSSPSGGASLIFDFPVDLAQAPSTYRPAAVANLFYWNNLIHDVFYQYGFDEVSGNFQENNYGRGGAASDYVYAEAQDGGGTNNANFATPVDGGNPRMQMYLWTNTSPQRDGDFDNGIISHEYGHGISIRLTGGPANSSCLNNQEQGGEGWSDWFGLMLTMKAGDLGTDRRGVGTYALGQPTNGVGIRTHPYSTDMSIDPRTYDTIKTAAVPHGVGSTWAGMLWEMTWGLIGQYGFDANLYTGTGGNNIALQLVVDGLKLQPCSPGFVDARNAILQADQTNNGGVNQCLIWNAFAKRGLGYSATQGSSGSRSDGVQAFDVPAACLQTLKITKSASPSPATAGQPLTYSLLVENQTAGTLSNVTVTDNVPAGVTYTGGLTCAGSQSGGVVTFTLGNMAAGASQTCSFDVTVDGGLGTQTFFSDDMESGGSPWSATAGAGAYNWSLGTANPHSPTRAWFAQDVSGITDQYLAMTNAVTLSGTPQLRFWHSYTTEANYDGGVVEISANGGAWTDLGSLMTQNGYNSTLSSSYSNPIGGRQAFSGSSSGYKETVVNLASYAGQSVRIRFRLGTDSSVGATGWYVDDVAILDEDAISNTACVNATGGQNDCDTVDTAVLPGSGPTATPTNTLPATATPTNTPTNTPPATATPTNTPTNTPPATATPTSTPPPTATPTPVPGADLLYLSSSSDGTAGGVSFADEDILTYDSGSAAWSLYFDGSDVGISANLDAFQRLSDGSILLSLSAAASIGSLGTVDDSDLVRFVPTSLGTTTAGTFEFYFDGSDVGLTTNTEDIDAVVRLPDGRLLFSTEGGFTVPGLSGGDEDLILFTPTALGTATSGTWSLYFDGSDVGLNTTNNEDVVGAWIDDATGDIYLTTLGAFSVSGVSGDGADIFICTPGSLGSTTTCTFSMYWDGSANGFAGEVVDGLSIQQ